MMFIPREAVLIDREGREVCVVPFTRRLDKIALQQCERGAKPTERHGSDA